MFRSFNGLCALLFVFFVDGMINHGATIVASGWNSTVWIGKTFC